MSDTTQKIRVGNRKKAPKALSDSQIEAIITMVAESATVGKKTVGHTSRK